MISKYSATTSISNEELKALVNQCLEQAGELKKVLVLPPDHTRLNSMAGPITAIIYDKLSAEGVHVDIMPALGTHNPMTEEQLRMMFGDSIPLDVFKVHDWRNGIVRVGEIPRERLLELSDGKVDYSVGVEVNKILKDGYDIILSIGQVVPHEVVGMANYTKNIVVGVGGADIINKSHFLGAACGIEDILGQTDTPVRELLNEAVQNYLGDLPITYILTVMEQDYDTGKMHMRGFYSSDDETAYVKACKLAREVNITLLDREPKKVVVYLDPEEFTSTWLGNKSVYRTRMAIADDGELVVLAPALKEFGEDPEIDKLIRKFGYCGTPATLKALKENDDLSSNLSAAAHLIHGSSEGRFNITYCPGEDMSLEEVRSVGFDAIPHQEAVEIYNPEELKDGWNTMADGEEIFFISNPALGLWAFKEKFQD